MLPPTTESQTAELAVVIDILNECCEEFPDTKEYLPISPSNVYEKLDDGVILARIANLLAKDLFPTRLIKSPAISAADKSSNKETAQKAIEKKGQTKFANFKHFVSGAAFQYLYHDVSLTENIPIIRTLKKGEGLTTLLYMPPEGILKRWFNYHLQRAELGSEVISNIQEVTLEQILILLRQLDNKSVIGQDIKPTPEGILKAATLLDVNRFVSVDSLTKQQPISTVAFLAHVFSNKLGIFLPTEEEMDHIMNEMRALKNKIFDHGNEIETLDKEITSLENQLSGLQKIQQYKEFQALETKLEKLKAKRQIYTTENEALFKELESKCSQFRAEVETLTSVQDQLNEAVKDHGEEFALLSKKLNDATNMSNDKSRAIHEHAQKLGLKFDEWGKKLKPVAEVTMKESNDDAEQLDCCLLGQTEILNKYLEYLKEIDVQFDQQKQDSKKRLDELNAMVSEYLGTGNTNAGEAIINMKKLLELMIEKCKKQSKQIATYDLTIEKMDDLNVLMDNKIKYYAQKNIKVDKKKLSKLQKQASTKAAN